jgi:hypothetical protein
MEFATTEYRSILYRTFIILQNLIDEILYVKFHRIYSHGMYLVCGILSPYIVNTPGNSGHNSLFRTKSGKNPAFMWVCVFMRAKDKNSSLLRVL